MATAPATTTKPRVSRLERIASGFTLLSALILGAYLLSRLNLLPLDPHVTWQAASVVLAPIAATLIGAVGSVFAWVGRRRTRALRAADERTTRAKVVEGLIALPAALQNLPDWLNWIRTSHAISTVFTAGVFVAAVGVTVVTGAPRAPLITFAGQLVVNCQRPLQDVYQHATDVRDAAHGDASDASAFRTAMEQSESNLQADATALPGVLHTLQGITPPQARYQSLLTDCESALQQAQGFLDTTDMAIAAPFNATVSGVSLLQAASALMITHPEEVSAAASAVFQVYDGELNQTTDLQNRLQNEANQLQTDLLTP